MAITATNFFAIAPADLTAETEDRFFTDLKTRNDTFKRTSAVRFTAVDRCCIGHFTRSHSPIAQVLDIGVSSGTTTLALHAALAQAGYDAMVTGTDLSLGAYIVPVRAGLRVLIDERGHPLQYEVLGRAVRSWGRRADAATGMGLVRRALHAASRGAIIHALGARGDARHPAPLRSVQLVSPRLADRPGIAIEANDIFAYTDRFAGRFDFIRAANILNRGYFDEPALARALANVAAYLAGPGSWLLTARTVGEVTDGTLFRVAAAGDRFEVAERIGAGSEIEALVLATPVVRRSAPA